MSKIKIEVWGNAVICEADQCAWKYECTNHHSAGDFRSDYGVRPTLTGLDTTAEVAWCSTTDVADEEQLDYGGMVIVDDVSSQLSLEL